jgi:ectoine hydroxylase-related dioxygenase (phytanoyl-CoA dioxygenase family)
MMTLTQQQIDEYRAEGYTRVGRVLAEEQLDAFRDEELRLREMILADGQTRRTVFVSQVCHMSETVRRFCTDGPQVDLGATLVGADLCLWFNQFVTKFPDENTKTSAFPWHQDNGYVMIEPPENVTFWVALDDVDETNGCIWVKPRTHKLGLLDHRTSSPDTWHLEVDVPGEEVPVPMKAGEAIAFTGLTVHGSKFNHTGHPRRAFFMEYAGADSWIRKWNMPAVASQHSWMVRGNSSMRLATDPLPAAEGARSGTGNYG